MKFTKFRVLKYRNIIDSGWIDINQVTAFVGQNEAGKSNLFDALYRVNPFEEKATYKIDEDWPVDDWKNKGKEKQHIVCRAQFVLNAGDILDLYEHVTGKKADGEGEDKLDKRTLPKKFTLEGRGYYNFDPHFWVVDPADHKLGSRLIA